MGSRLKKEKRILFIMGGLVHYYNPILEAINALDGYELATLTPEKSTSSLGKGVHQEKNNLGFQSFFLPEKRGLFRKSFFKGFNQLISSYRPDVIIAGWPYTLEILLNPFIRKNGILIIHKDIPFNLPKYEDALRDFRSGKIIVSENYDHYEGGDLKAVLNYWLVTKLRKLFLSAADAHVCYTDAAFEIFPSYGVNPERIFIIYNSPSTKELMAAREQALKADLLFQPNPNRIIHVGRLVRWKKVSLVLKAIHRIKPQLPSIELLIVGDGPDRESLVSEVRSMGLENNVIFLGAVYDPIMLARYHKESALYVLGGIGGLSINEAMCFGKGVVCSVADGTEKMLVRENENGVYFESDNYVDLANKLLALLTRPEKCLQFGERSLEIIRGEINEFKVIEGYKKALNYLFQNKK